MELSQLLFTFFVFICGAVLALIGWSSIYRKKIGGFIEIASEMIEKAEKDADALKIKNEIGFQKAELKHQKYLNQLSNKEKEKVYAEEQRIKKREDKLEKRVALTDKKELDLEKRESKIADIEKRLSRIELTHKESESALRKKYECLGGMDSKQAKEALLKEVEAEVTIEAAKLSQDIKREAKENAETDARRLMSTVINRLAASYVSEATVTTIPLPSEEIKGRIIGREGRNIKTLERLTGVNFILDDTPGTIILSAFDPVRKEVAKASLKELFTDGRIHPSRIEEVVPEAEERIMREVKKAGEDVVFQLGIVDMHPELIAILGKLKYRYSYGQNILKHSAEVANIMCIMAAELGLDTDRAKRIGLLHDIGKAFTQVSDDPHALIGYDLALKYGESKEVANGIGCHHYEIPPETIEGSLCSAADALSGARPGARIDAVENYIKRLQDLEDLAYEFPGVEKAYALQAGKEVRVVLLPEMIDDAGATMLARNLSKQIKKRLNYPGKIRITVTREKRIVEYA
jgi:ribonuclease Y